MYIRGSVGESPHHLLALPSFPRSVPLATDTRRLAPSRISNFTRVPLPVVGSSSITLLIPLVCFIFPVIFVVLLGPAVIAIIRGFSAFGQ